MLPLLITLPHMTLKIHIFLSNLFNLHTQEPPHITVFYNISRQFSPLVPTCGLPPAKWSELWHNAILTTSFILCSKNSFWIKPLFQPSLHFTSVLDP